MKGGMALLLQVAIVVLAVLSVGRRGVLVEGGGGGGDLICEPKDCLLCCAVNCKGNPNPSCYNDCVKACGGDVHEDILVLSGGRVLPYPPLAA
ncbi:unnamed protein product [Cuscuta campestris]|uniref:Bowman-Birk serine protease inhibitors family domain-containing protein n=1 Tax=Cuscuta campestris TaxID=132261 RepID=A0A484NUU6_9ASTE|nr:unnamed protein product [Cuscuta campestris]